MSNYPALPPHGWQRVILELSDEVLANLLDEAKSLKYEPIFEKVGSDTPDPNRLQSRLPETTGSFSPDMKIHHEHAGYAARSRDSLYVPRTYSFLWSKGNGNEQDPHQDFIPSVISRVTKNFPGTIPCNMAIALMPGTHLKVFAGCFNTVDTTKAKVLELQPGHAVLFRADLIHCGMAFAQANYRLYCYVTVPGPAFEPDVVAGVDEKVFTRRHCGRRDTDSNAIRQHRFYCKDNPKAKNHTKTETGKRRCMQCQKWFNTPGSLRTHRFRNPGCVPLSAEAKK